MEKKETRPNKPFRLVMVGEFGVQTGTAQQFDNMVNLTAPISEYPLLNVKRVRFSVCIDDFVVSSSVVPFPKDITFTHHTTFKGSALHGSRTYRQRCKLGFDSIIDVDDLISPENIGQLFSQTTLGYIAETLPTVTIGPVWCLVELIGEYVDI